MSATNMKKERTAQEQVDTGRFPPKILLKIIIEICFHISNGTFPANKNRAWFKNWIRDNI